MSDTVRTSRTNRKALADRQEHLCIPRRDIKAAPRIPCRCRRRAGWLSPKVEPCPANRVPSGVYCLGPEQRRWNRGRSPATIGYRESGQTRSSMALYNRVSSNHPFAAPPHGAWRVRRATPVQCSRAWSL